MPDGAGAGAGAWGRAAADGKGATALLARSALWHVQGPELRLAGGN